MNIYLIEFSFKLAELSKNFFIRIKKIQVNFESRIDWNGKNLGKTEISSPWLRDLSGCFFGVFCFILQLGQINKHICFCLNLNLELLFTMSLKNPVSKFLIDWKECRQHPKKNDDLISASYLYRNVWVDLT